ncbi:MAG: TfoX/Sxy family protein [Sphingomonadales bacterium]|nr:TfoX/Sxy family protein [Sphingomonadales bacterium]
MAKARPELVDYFASEFCQLGVVEVKHFFGGWQFRCGGKQFAAYIRDTLYFRVDAELRAALEARGSEPFWYDKQGKIVTVTGYQSAPDSALDDGDELLLWAARAIEVK